MKGKKLVERVHEDRSKTFKRVRKMSKRVLGDRRKTFKRVKKMPKKVPEDRSKSTDKKHNSERLKTWLEHQ